MKNTDYDYLINPLDFDKIEKLANDLYGAGRYDILQIAWETLPEGEKYHYPNIGYNYAKKHISQGDFADAINILTLVRKAYQDDPELLSRVFLLFAHIYCHSQNFEAMDAAIKQVEETSKNPARMAECDYLRGEYDLALAPVQAYQHFQNAFKKYAHYLMSGKDVTYDMARAAQRMATAAFANMDYQNGNKAQLDALKFSQGHSPELRSWIEMNSGIHDYYQGHYAEAIEHLNNAIAIMPDNQTRVKQCLRRKAEIAVLTHNFVAAEDELNRLGDIETQENIGYMDMRLTTAMLQFFKRDMETALQTIGEIFKHVPADTLQFHKAQMWKTAILIDRYEVSADDLDCLQAAIDFFIKNNRFHESSQARLIYAWGCEIEGRTSEIHETLTRCLLDVEKIKHIKHLYQIYIMSQEDLERYWENIREKVRKPFLANIESYRREVSHNVIGEHIRVKSFGQPRIIVGDSGKIVKPRAGGKNVSFSIVHLMLHYKTSTRDKIISDIWSFEEETARGQKALIDSFNGANSRLRNDEFGFDWQQYDSSTNTYHLKEEVVISYDAWEFDKGLRELRQSQQDEDIFKICDKLVELYKGDYLPDFDIVPLNSQREHYRRRFREMLKDCAIPVAERMGKDEKVAAWKTRLSEFNVIDDDTYN